MLRKSVGVENGKCKSFSHKVVENDLENIYVEMESGKVLRRKLPKMTWKCLH